MLTGKSFAWVSNIYAVALPQNYFLLGFFSLEQLIKWQNSLDPKLVLFFTPQTRNATGRALILHSLTAAKLVVVKIWKPTDIILKLGYFTYRQINCSTKRKKTNTIYTTWYPFTDFVKFIKCGFHPPSTHGILWNNIFIWLPILEHKWLQLSAYIYLNLLSLSAFLFNDILWSFCMFILLTWN